MSAPAKPPAKWSEEEKQIMHAHIFNNCLNVGTADYKLLSEQLGRSIPSVYEQWRRIAKPALYKQCGLDPAMAATPPTPKKQKNETPKKETGKAKSPKKRKASPVLPDFGKQEPRTPSPRPSSADDFYVEVSD